MGKDYVSSQEPSPTPQAESGKEAREMGLVASADFAEHAHPDWDADYRRVWMDLQAAERNKMIYRRFMLEALTRAETAEAVLAALPSPKVSADANDHTMGGSLVFVGTRLPVSTIMARVAAAAKIIMQAEPCGCTNMDDEHVLCCDPSLDKWGPDTRLPEERCSCLQLAKAAVAAIDALPQQGREEVAMVTLRFDDVVTLMKGAPPWIGQVPPMSQRDQRDRYKAALFAINDALNATSPKTGGM